MIWKAYGVSFLVSQHTRQSVCLWDRLQPAWRACLSSAAAGLGYFNMPWWVSPHEASYHQHSKGSALFMLLWPVGVEKWVSVWGEISGWLWETYFLSPFGQKWHMTGILIRQLQTALTGLPYASGVFIRLFWSLKSIESIVILLWPSQTHVNKLLYFPIKCIQADYLLHQFSSLSFTTMIIVGFLYTRVENLLSVTSENFSVRFSVVKTVSKFDPTLADADGWGVNIMVVLNVILRFPDIVLTLTCFRQYWRMNALNTMI